MTDMQIKYWDLQSQKELRAAQQKKAIAEEGKAKAETESVLTLLPAQREKVLNEASRIYEEIALTQSRTDLTKTEKQESISKTVKNYIDSLKNISSEIREWISGGKSKSGGSGQGMETIIQILGLIL